MSGKNDRERQKRRQRKREKRAAKAKRSARPSGGERYGGIPDPRELPTPASLATIACVEACELLLSGAGAFDPEGRRDMVSFAKLAGGIWPRLPFELERFLYEDAPWSLTCADIEPVRRAFARYGAEEAFDRLWCLALTNEPEGAAALAAHEDGSCAQRAAVAFHALRLCLEDPANDAAVPLGRVVDEMHQHGAPATLRNSYRKLLAAAVASVHKPVRSRTAAVDKLARTAERLFERESTQWSHTAWWQCGRLFLAEVFDRHASNGFAASLARHPELAARLFDPARAAVWMARYASTPGPLRSISFQADPESWLRFLRQRLDVQTLSFEDRLRYEIARLKLVRARATRAPEEGDAAGEPDHVEFLAAFGELRALLAHGVPPAHRSLSDVLESPLVDFYIDAVCELHCEGAGLHATEQLLRRHPDDFRLACLYATGALMRGERHKLGALAGRSPGAHVDAQLFARCVGIWSELPRSSQAAAAVRPLLFDCLDREHRKLCLLALARHALRRASDIDAYDRELRNLLPYFERDSFVYRELREEAALESGLVFLATMMAPLHDMRLSLTESQSRQWVSHARELAQQSSVGAKLAARYLTTPSRWFTLAPSVADAARSRLDEFRPSRPPSPARARTGTPAESKSQERRGPRPRRSPRVSAGSPSQPSLFDGIDT